MEEVLISLETAKLAKEKGFNQFYCNTHYNKIDKLIVDTEGYPNGDRWVEYMKYCISAPTQSLLQKWLREKHNIHIVCWWYDKEDKFYTELGRKTKEKIFVQCGNTTLLFNTYEEALEEGLQEALKHVKN